MKKGNIGLALGMIGKKLRNSIGSVPDSVLSGKNEVVHPSLAVGAFFIRTKLYGGGVVFFFTFWSFFLQESAQKFEQNVHLFGSTVESLLYRYGKVTFHV